MTGKDILTLLLVIYDFKEICIKTYKGSGNTQGYKIEAYNKEHDFYYIEENCEGLMFNITHIINQMEKYKIKPTYTPFQGYEYTITKILSMFK